MFEFQDHTPIHAYVLAADKDDAHELFGEYVLAQGGDPDDLMWRELGIRHLGDEERAAIREARSLTREGVVARRGGTQWVFVVPLGLRA
ncbi:hypothetical protein [Sphingomonas sediminicola]|uniref:hypothetical protein n=1 Tax=Sphingomonas sediminicola TaxID=386874 RepID=UPI0019624621|nr:hypothetical protein ['Sphingomonas ginsengisoli' Hoang et al. 2012]